VDGLISELTFLLQRLDWAAALDIILVAAIVFALLRLARGTQAVVLLRGLILLVAFLALLTTLLPLAAFSWLLRAALPALIVAIPVIFAPELRRALERLGRASAVLGQPAEPSHIERTVEAIANASQRLADTRQGALIVIERETPLDEYVETGVMLDAVLTPELLLQVFHVNTPLHDGAVILRNERLLAAGCVMPLSASGTLSRSPERHMGLRHRAALGISEVSDAVAVVVSEETGALTVAHNGRMIRRLDINRLRNILIAFYRPRRRTWIPDWMDRLGARARQRRVPRPTERD
jgi:diadenylate cyclase